MPKSSTFIIAINDYTHENVSSLRTPLNDAKGLAKVLSERYDFDVTLCLNPDKSTFIKDFEAFIKKLSAQVQTDDSKALIYFAGHGLARNSEKGLEGYLLLKDASKEADSWLSMVFLEEKLMQIPCKHSLLILDCCFAGAFRQATTFRKVSFEDEPVSRQHYVYYTQHTSQQVLTSASQTQKALDNLSGRLEKGNHSPFAKCLIDALQGAADRNNDGVLTLTEIYAYLQERIPILAGEKNHSQNVGLFPLGKHENGEFLFVPNDFNPEKLRIIDYEEPYKGLSVYEPEDAHLFFGRKEAIDELWKKVAKQPLTVVVGASGTGKSSLIRAGIVPLLQKEGKLVEIMRPGQSPLAILASTPDFEVLVIDQLEELITQSNENEVLPFLQKIRDLVEKAGKKILITLRIDFESQIIKGSLDTYWTEGRYRVPLFSAEELRQIIITPAARVGRFIEPISLVNDIIEEIIYYPGALPLLSFTMSELFKKCEGALYRNMTAADYKEMGGVTGALQKTADRIDNVCNEAEKISLKNLLLRMVSLSGGETAGKRVFLTELTFEENAETQRVEKLKQQLINARLVRADEDNEKNQFIEPAHDALVRTWKRLQEWIKEVKEENILLQSKLSTAVIDYQKNENASAFLWDNSPNLEQVSQAQKDNILFLNQPESVFIRLSVQAKKRTRNIRYGLLGAAFVIISSLAIFSYFKADEATANAERATKQQKIAERQAFVADSNAEVAKAQTQRANDSTRSANEQRAIAVKQTGIAVANADSAKKNLTKFTKATVSDYYNRGMALIDAKNYSAAIEQFNQALKLEATHSASVKQKEFCVAKLKYKNAFELAIRQGIEAENKEQFAQAYNRYQEAFEGAYNNDSVNRRINVLLPKMRNAITKLKEDAATQIDAGEKVNIQAAKAKYQKAIELAKLLKQNTTDLEQQLQNCEKQLAK